MKSGIILTLIAWFGIAFADDAIPNPPNSTPAVHVATALDHITVLEFGEVVTMAAAGSQAFHIERIGDKVLVEPLKAGAATDLIVWTSTRRFTYELQSPGEVKDMQFAIDAPFSHPKTIANPIADDQRLDEIADMVLTRAFLGSEQIDSTNIRLTKDRVTVRIERVFHSRNTTYVYYLIANRTKTAYVVDDPTITRLESLGPVTSLANLLNKQIPDAGLRSLGAFDKNPIALAHAETNAKELQPGEETQGVLAIREAIKSPIAMQLTFKSHNEFPVRATVVF